MVASTLRRGDVAVIGYNTGQTDASGTTIDSFEFVLLAAIGSATVIRFTDRAWAPTGTALNGGSFTNAGGDGAIAFTAATDIAAGTVIKVTFSGGNVVFTVNGVATTPVSAGGFDLNEAGDAIYVYQGTDANTPTAFLSATEIGDGNATFNGSLVNTGLVSGVTAVSTALDSATYHGPTTDAFAHFHNSGALLANVMDATNWVGDDADGQKALDQVDHTGPYNLAPDVSLWVAGQGGGNGLIHVGGDATVSSGTVGFNQTQLYTNLLNAGLPVLAGARDIAFDTVEGKFFVAEGTRILQGNIADLLGNPATPPTLTVLFTSTQATTPPLLTGENQIYNLEVDSLNNIVYFSHGSRLEKIGYNTAGQTSTVLANLNTGNPTAGTNRNLIDDFVIHYASGNVYLTSHRIVSGQDGDQLTKNYIYRITGLDAADGTNAFTFANGAITFLPFSPDDDDATNGFTWAPGEAFPQEEGTLEGIAISPDGSTLYFTAATTLYDNDADGGVAGGPGTAPQLRLGGVFSYALTANPTGVYAQIWQQLDDGDIVSQATSPTFGPQGLLDDIEVDPVTGHLYFLDQTGDQLGATNPPGDEGIWRIAPNGTGLTYFANINNINAMGPSSIILNRAPTVISSTQATPGVTEASNAANSGATSLVQPFLALDVSDTETAGNPTQQLAGATVWISANFQSGVTHQDTLTINGTQSGTANGITYSYNAATGAMKLTGVATFNSYEATIALVRFNTSGDDPTAYGTATSRTISWAVSDGLNHSDPVSTTVSVTGVNDAPVNTAGAAMNFTEDTTGAAAGTPVNAVTGISVFDVDADPATQVITVTLSVNVGTLSIRTDVSGGLAAGGVSGNTTGTLVLTGTQNQINATLAAVNGAAQPNGLVFTPSGNFNGAANLTITTNDAGFNGNDPGLTGTGTTEQDQDVKTLNVADVNDAPAVDGDGTESLPTILEDVPYTNLTAPSVATLFGGQFADAIDVQVSGGNPTGSPGDTLAGVAIVVNGSNANGAWQWWDGAAWQAVGAASVDAAKTFSAATLLRFNPTLNFNGTAPTLTANLIESGGTAITNGGTVDLNPAPPTVGAGSVYTSGTVVLSQAITAVNDAPTSAGLSGDTVTYTEQQAQAVFLDLGSNAVLNDVDSANFNTGTLTVAITTGLVSAQDQLVIRVTGTVSFNGSAVFVNGTQIGTYTGAGAGGGPLVFTFDPDATPAAVAEVVRAIAYTNSGGDNPTAGSRTISWTFVDGGGTANTGVDTLAVTSTVNVVAVNDPPAGANATLTTAEDTAYSFTVADFALTDPEGHTLSQVRITTTPSLGAITLSGSPVLAGDTVNVAAIAAGNLRYTPPLNANGAGYTSFTFRVIDNGGTANGGVAEDQSANTLTFNVTPVNDAPAYAAGGAQPSYTENGPALNIATGVTLTDVDNTTFNTGTLTVGFANLVAGDAIGLRATGPTGGGGNGIEFAGGIVSYNGTAFATLTGSTATQLVFTFTAGSNPTNVIALSQAITFASASDNPTNASRTVTFTLVDGGGTANSGADTASFTRTVSVTPADDAPAAVADTFSTTENQSIFTTAPIAYLTFNDTDVDGGPKSIVSVNGQAGNVDTQITLPSGALITVNANGYFIYNPNGAFNYLVAAGGGTGGQSSATDSFTYTLNGGSSTTVTVTINGVTSAGDQIRGSAGSETLTGTPGSDYFNISQGGADVVNAGASNDTIFTGAGFSADDMIDGGAGTDQISLRGSYTGSLGNVTNTEFLGFLSGTSTRFGGDGTARYSYDVTTTNATVAAGVQYIVQANELVAGENLRFDGSAELDGSFIIYAGRGIDTFIGGSGNDGFFFGEGGRFTAADTVVGGLGGADQLGLRGNYTGGNAVTFLATTMTGIETIVLLSASQAGAAAEAASYIYSLTLNDANVAPGQQLRINASQLGATEIASVVGSSETNGNFFFIGGDGNDGFTGGAGDDIFYGGRGQDNLTGGNGADTFRYGAVTDSLPGAAQDIIYDFRTGDTIDLAMIDAVTGGADDAFTIVAGAAFTGVAGQLLITSLGGGGYLVQGDIDGVGGADFAITVNSDHALTAADFIL